VGDWKSVLTGGWFQTDGAVPSMIEVATDGWWNVYDSTVPVVVEGGVIDLGLMVQMRMGL